MSSASTFPDPVWPGELYDLLRRHDVTQFAYVPDAGHKTLWIIFILTPLTMSALTYVWRKE